jgi:hypothetical protein
MPDDAVDVRERVIAAATAAAELELWSVAGAPPRLQAAAAHLLDAVTDLHDASALRSELEDEGISVPLGVLVPETDEDAILPQHSVWAAYRQLLDAVEIMSAASLVPPWPGEPGGWRPVVDELTYALWAVSALEDRAAEFASNHDRPSLLEANAENGETAPMWPETMPKTHRYDPGGSTEEPSTGCVDTQGSRGADAAFERRRVDAGAVDGSVSPQAERPASSRAQLHQ